MKRVKYITFNAKYTHLLKEKKKKKLLAPKFNNLLKHQGHKKAKVSMLDIDVSTIYCMQCKLNACSK
jgi:hypothetical protein